MEKSIQTMSLAANFTHILLPIYNQSVFDIYIPCDEFDCLCTMDRVTS